MDHSRAHGHTTIGATTDAYVVEITSMRREWAGLNAEELEEIRDVLISYLIPHAKRCRDLTVSAIAPTRTMPVPRRSPVPQRAGGPIGHEARANR
jgi:hypothetical protein